MKRQVSLALSNPLRHYRDQREITQGDLADQVRVHKSTLSQIECGYIVPSLELAYRLSEVTGISLERLARFCLRLTSEADGSTVVDFPRTRRRA